MRVDLITARYLIEGLFFLPKNQDADERKDFLLLVLIECFKLFCYVMVEDLQANIFLATHPNLPIRSFFCVWLILGFLLPLRTRIQTQH